jgi:V8-like Glu-specific endopeptidase
MSGGPVLNSKRKVIGVLYCGDISETSPTNGFVPLTGSLFKDYINGETNDI